MTFALHKPAAPLCDLVQSIWSMELGARNAEMPGLIAPDSHVEFVFHVGGGSEMRRTGTGWERFPARCCTRSARVASDFDRRARAASSRSGRAPSSRA